MSEVYKGEHVELGRMVAIKVLHPFLADEEGFVVRFKREARIVATLRQHNIVQVYDFDFNDELGIYYMVMEFIDGPTLKDLLNDGPLSVDEAARIGVAICEALDYAHEREMVHRDVKPANIMFIPDGEPVLTDFGIAKMLSLSELTASGAMVGTPAYMAPEVGIGKVGTSLSDIYSMGVVLYQMVAGRLPFESDSPMGMVMHHINDTPPPLTRFTSSVPPAFESIILRAMEKQPEMRFERARDMARALRRVLGEPAEHSSAAMAPLPEAMAAAPPAPDKFVTDDRVIEDDDRLLRTWPPTNEVTPYPGTPTHFPKPPVQAAAAGDAAKPARRVRFQRIVSAVMIGIVVGITGFLVWTGITGDTPPVLTQLLALAQQRSAAPVAVTVSPETATVVPAASATATPGPTPAPVTVTPTPVPNLNSPKPTPVTCDTRLKLNQVRIEPDDVVGPGTKFTAYVSLQNNGDCRWPQALRFMFESGERMTDADSFPVAQVGPDETVQLVLPMVAPTEIGVYESLWSVQLANGNVVGIPIAVPVEVGDVAAPPPTPLPPGTTTLTIEPLAMEAPTVLAWKDDAVRSRWSGTVVFTATGGAGSYRYYQDEVRADTLLAGGQILFEWRRCEGVPVSVWVVSGKEAINWEGVVPYPEPDRCQ